ncbi:MAG: hypothetical protein JWM89_1116 [Acidimicrobiales bacterium]|nr:hypothetical protein [Acidimicrobiales bacterium]
MPAPADRAATIEVVERAGLVDLLVPFEEARRLAVAAASDGEWLDATLLVAGCSQVVEDHIHRSEGLLDRLAVHVTGNQAALGAPAQALDHGAAAVRAAHRARRRVAALLPSRDALLELAVDLAAAALGGPAVEDLARRTSVALGPAASWPATIAEHPPRLPSCFRSFDQHPADVVSLVARYADRHPDRSEPALVAGIRTSGSYLGPLAVAELRRLGYESRLVTLRAGERLDQGQAAAAEACVGGHVVVIDDPPVSGGTVRDCIRTLVRAGFGPDQVVLLLALPEGWTLAPFLDPYEQVVLPGAEWHVRTAFDAANLEGVAARLLDRSGRTFVGPLAPADDPVGAAPGGAPRTPREHRRAAFAVRVAGPGEGAEIDATLLVQGTGVGLFGRHDAAVASQLGGLVPDVLGVDDGLLYQLVGRAGPRVDPAIDPAGAAAYVLARHRALPVAVDRSEAMRGRKAAWEVAAMIVGAALGRADLAVRIPVVEPLVRSLLRVAEPSVIDGRMTVDRWLPALGGDGIVKADHADGAFSNRDLWSYDPVADLAAIGDELGLPREVLAEWLAQGGTPVAPSRWLLHRFVHAWDQHRLGALAQPEYGRRVGAALVDHVGALFLADLPTPSAETSGPWCVVDVDGVLETGVLPGASAPGRAGGLVLRSLATHGFRVVPATGRSVAEVATRVAAWDLAAGIAEYGTALVIGSEIVDLRSEAAAQQVDRARAWLEEQPGILVDPGHRHALRAWRTTGSGGRGPLTPADVTGAREAAGEPLVAVPGDDQTDLVPAGCSKEVAVRALLARLDPDRAGLARPLALAAGDGPADLGLLGLAELAVVPGHAEAGIRALATTPSKAAYQAGLAEGVASLVGHAPGACPTCRVDLEPAASALLAALSVREAGPRGIAPRLAGLVRSVVALRR